MEGLGEASYSEFHMSSGERSILRISKDVSRLENALVLIDEIDTGLHPYTQQQAMLELQRSALRQNLQIVVATHSPVVLDSVPPEARIFLDRDESTGQVRRAPPHRDVFRKALYGRSGDRLFILCEDAVAEGVLRGEFDVLNVSAAPPAPGTAAGAACSASSCRRAASGLTSTPGASGSAARSRAPAACATRSGSRRNCSARSSASLVTVGRVSYQ